jgi:hypothetical protein
MPRRPGSDLDFINQAVELREQQAWADELNFHPRVFCQLALPYAQPKDNPPVWVRRNGPFVLTVRPSFVEASDGSYVPAYPTGTVPRLLLTWMATEVIRQREWEQSPELVLGENLTDFIRRIGLGHATGGKKGTITRLRESTNRLFDAVISAAWEGDPSRDVGRNFVIAEEKRLWWNDDDRILRQQALSPSSITLSATFYRELRQHSVPLSLLALRILQKYGPQPLDIYVWLCHRLPYLHQPRVDISWEQLRAQFGSTLRDTKQGRWKFQNRFEANLRRVLEVYETAKVQVTDSGVVLRPSPPHVDRKELSSGRT